MTVTTLALDSIKTWGQNRSAYAFSEKLDLAEFACSLLELSARQCGLERPFYFRVIEGKDKPFLLYDGKDPDFERLSNAVKQVANDLLLYWKPLKRDELPTDNLKHIFDCYTEALAFSIGSWGPQIANFSILEKVVNSQTKVHLMPDGGAKTNRLCEIYLIGKSDAVQKAEAAFKELFQL